MDLEGLPNVAKIGLVGAIVVMFVIGGIAIISWFFQYVGVQNLRNGQKSIQKSDYSIRQIACSIVSQWCEFAYPKGRTELTTQLRKKSLESKFSFFPILILPKKIISKIQFFRDSDHNWVKNKFHGPTGIHLPFWGQKGTQVGVKMLI